MLRRRLMMLAQSLFYWIRINEKLVLGRKAKGEDAPAEVVTSRRAMRFGRPVHAGDYPAEDIVAKRSAVIGKEFTAAPTPAESIAFARAMQMGRAQPFWFKIHPITLLKGLFMSRKAVLGSATGTPATARWSMQIGRKAAGKRADTETTQAKRAFRIGRKAVANGYVGQPEEAGRAMGIGVEIAPGPAAADPFDAKRSAGMGRKAKAATWIDPEILLDGSLLIRQAYYAEMIDGVLEVS